MNDKTILLNTADNIQSINQSKMKDVKYNEELIEYSHKLLDVLDEELKNMDMNSSLGSITNTFRQYVSESIEHYKENCESIEENIAFNQEVTETLRYIAS